MMGNRLWLIVCIFVVPILAREASHVGWQLRNGKVWGHLVRVLAGRAT
jgi:hypothetical protein